VFVLSKISNQIVRVLEISRTVGIHRNSIVSSGECFPPFPAIFVHEDLEDECQTTHVRVDFNVHKNSTRVTTRTGLKEGAAVEKISGVFVAKAFKETIPRWGVGRRRWKNLYHKLNALWQWTRRRKVDLEVKSKSREHNEPKMYFHYPT
jgi:hypothetical protein